MAKKTGLLVIGHGSREAGWVQLVDDTVKAASERLHMYGQPDSAPISSDLSGADHSSYLPVEAAFLELVDGRLIQDGIDRLEAAGVEHVLALPLFVSSGSTHVDEIGWALGAFAEARTETELTPMRVHAELTYGQPLDEDEELVDVLLERALALAGSVAKPPFSNVPASDETQQTAILLIAHGSKVPGFQEAWERGMQALGRRLVERGGFADFEPAMLQLEEVGERWRELRRRRPHDTILAVPLFLSEGYFTRTVIPRELNGLDCLYDGTTLLPHGRLSDWIVRRADEWRLSL